MEYKFRALRLVALICRIVAWIVLVSGAIAALLLIVLGAVAAKAGGPSPLLAGLPVATRIVGPLSGLLAGVAVLMAALLQFLLIYAGNEVINLGLAIEQNTRETAYYLRGEGALPPPPSAISWEPPDVEPPRP
jgi:hypothetical protein